MFTKILNREEVREYNRLTNSSAVIVYISREDNDYYVVEDTNIRKKINNELLTHFL